MSAFDVPVGMKCQNCNERVATSIWMVDGGTIGYIHGCYAYWCELCALRVQLANAKERALEIPKMEARIAEIEGVGK